MITIVLLAAGQSRRFGSACKLQALYRGKPLLRHAADAICALGCPAVAVVADPAVAALLPEFRIVYSDGPQSRSLLVGIGDVPDGPALVVLGDMPHVDAALLRRIASVPGPAMITDGSTICPPARIPRSLFPSMGRLTGDQGAGLILRDQPDLALVRVSSTVIADIDIQEDIEI